MPTFTPPAVDAPSVEWKAYAASLGAHVLALPMGAPVELPGQPPLVIAHRSWDPDKAQGPAVLAAGSDYTALMAALGPADRVLATEDGKAIDASAWCPRDMVTDGPCLVSTVVFYARYTTAGCVAHGFVCAACHKLVQTG